MTDPVRPVAPREQLIADLRFFASGLAHRPRTPWEHGVMKLLMDAATELESLAAAPVPCAASPADGWFDVKQNGETVAWFKSREDAEAYTGTLIARELPR